MKDGKNEPGGLPDLVLLYTGCLKRQTSLVWKLN